MPKKVQRVRVFEMCNGVSLDVDYGVKAIPQEAVLCMAQPIKDWTLFHDREVAHGEIVPVEFSFMKIMKQMSWREGKGLIEQLGFETLVQAEQETLRQAPANCYDKVLDMVNTCPVARNAFPNGVQAFTMAGLSTSVSSINGVRLYAFVQVDKGEAKRGYQMTYAEDDMIIPSAAVIPLIRGLRLP